MNNDNHEIAREIGTTIDCESASIFADNNKSLSSKVGNLARAYLDAKDRIGILNEKLNWQNHRNSGWPTRGGYEFYAAEGWNAAPEMSHIMRERYDPDDDRVRVRRVAEDDQLLADLAAEKKRVAELVELVNSIVSDGVRREMHTRTELARIMGKETHDDES